MSNSKSKFWKIIARLILRNKILIISLLSVITIVLCFQWKHLKMSFTEANMLPETHPISLDYQKFREMFGEEANLIMIACEADKIFSEENFSSWNQLSKEIQDFEQVQAVISTHNLKELTKDTISQSFKLEDFFNFEKNNSEEIYLFKEKLLQKSPFYEGILFNKEKNILQMAISVKKDIVNTKERKVFVLEKLLPKVKFYEKLLKTELKISGMPYIRTLNTEIISSEISLFILGALTITCIILFFFFRSFRAMFISMGVVVISVCWSFGFLGLFGYEITILTAVIPPLLIVIGLPNCIFLINRYQQEIKKHNYKAMALQRVIMKVGNVTLITNFTTAVGFATFALTESSVLKEFGIIAFINILCLFFISICLIPIFYSYMPRPKEKHLKHLDKRWIERLIFNIERIVKEHRFASYSVAVGLLVASIFGIFQIKISGSIIEDMPKNTQFYRDILFFEEKFGGVMPLEITLNTGRKNGVLQHKNLQKMSEFEDFLDEIKEISKPLSVVSLAKYAKQSFYNSNPEYFDLPTQQERLFISSYLKNSTKNQNLLNNMMDSLGQTARISVLMKDIGTEKMQKIEEDIIQKLQKLFPEENYEVKLSGKAYLFMKGTDFLVKNLFQSLLITILIISALMFFMFRSFRMVLISIIPNLLPLIITAGMMGFLGIALKPSTILVFGIAFGISVDDTLHFLAKYRQELVHNHWKIRKSVYAALRDTGISMFYTSVVLFFGFSIFILSDFGGTKALGGLIAITLFFAVFSNLVLLPSLLLSLERSIARKEILKEPSIDILEED